MKTTVVYHSADFDGLFCREIGRKFIPDAQFIGWDFTDPPLSLGKLNDRLIVMDLPLDKPFGGWDGRWAEVDPNVIWIDHHKSAIDTHSPLIPGYRIDGVAACRLAWQWFQENAIADRTGEAPRLPDKEAFLNRSISEPLAVRLAGEYDVFDKRDPNAQLFQHGLRSDDIDSTQWEWLLGCEETFTRQLLAQGRIVQHVQQKEYEQVITKYGFDLEFADLKFLACCSHRLDTRSQLFEAGVKPHHDALLGFSWTGKVWSVSMYHAPGKESHDLSVIAVKHGGGGHRGACGFTCKQLPFTL